MLRKLATIFVSLVLLIATSGVSITANYCGEDLTSISLNGQEKHCCDNPKCCHSEVNISQLQDNYVSSDFQVSFADSYTFSPVILSNLLEYSIYDVDFNTFNTGHFKFPPPPKPQQGFVALQSFLL